MEKVCRCCGQTKPISDFYKHQKMADGHLNKCKECQKDNSKAARARRPDYYRAYDKSRANLPHRVKARQEYAQTERGKDRHLAANQNWARKHPNRKAANQILNNALRNGKVQRNFCFVCGAKANAHHPDYDRPLDVIWLCPKHHKETHLMVSEQC